MKKLSKERYSVTHNHTTKQTQLRRELDVPGESHVLQRYQWLPGILTTRQAIALTMLAMKGTTQAAQAPQDSQTQLAFNPVCLSRLNQPRLNQPRRLKEHQPSKSTSAT